MKKKVLALLTALTMTALVGCSQGEEVQGNSSEQNENIEKVFVYGSLRSDMFNYDIYLDGKVTSNVPATIDGNLFHLESDIEEKEYPAAIPGEGKVLGELMEFKDFDTTLKELDELEWYVEGEEDENEYNRKVIEVELEDGTKEKAYYYEYNIGAEYNLEDRLVSVPSGDWKAFMEAREK